MWWDCVGHTIQYLSMLPALLKHDEVEDKCKLEVFTFGNAGQMFYYEMRLNKKLNKSSII